MNKLKLRDAIAAAAARLLLRHKEADFGAARKRAARWLSRRKVRAADMPSNAEIQTQLYALWGLFSAERQQAALFEIRHAALELMELLEPFQPRLFGCAINGPVVDGSEITLRLLADAVDEVVSVLHAANLKPRVLTAESDRTAAGDEQLAEVRIRIGHRFACEIMLVGSNGRTGGCSDNSADQSGLDIQALRELIQSVNVEPAEPLSDETPPTATDEHEYHPDAFGVLRMLLSGLKHVELDWNRHPEGNALYHSLQVYGLGMEEHPYDEEFLLACLLHDVGLGINRRQPVRATLEALNGLISPRTLFLIEHRVAATEFLKTGRIAGSLRKSEHFDDLVLLARCDRDGRVPGEDVVSVDEALEYIGGLATAWDDV